MEQSSNDTDTDTRLPSAMCDERKKGYGSLLLCSLVLSRPETDDVMKAYTHGQGKTRDERGETMPSQGFSTSDACGEAHTTHQRKLCYKRAFDSGEGMGRGWEWVGLVRGLFVIIVLTVRWWASPRSMSIKRSGLKKRSM